MIYFTRSSWDRRNPLSATVFKPEPVKPAVSKAALDALDIRVGRIEAVDEMAGADRLVALRVYFGDHRRIVVAGIKRERRDLAALVGRQALFVVNMEPRRVRGVLSEGMLFDIGFDDGVVPVLAVPEAEVPNGVRAG